MAKKSIFILVQFLIISLQAQDFSGSWKDYFSYNDIRDISFGNNKIYAASENAFFTYDVNTNEVQKKSTVNGLSGETIVSINYNEATNRLIIGHDNGLIEVFDEDTEDVINVIEIVEKLTIPPNTKSVNHIMEFNGLMYLSCDFGISLYDIAQLEFDDTYFIGPNGSQISVRQTTIFGDFIYAATDVGVYRAPIGNDNLIDFDQWEVVMTTNGQDWLGIQEFGTDLYGARNNRRLYRFDGTSFVQVAVYASDIKDVRRNGDNLLVTTMNEVFVYDNAFIQTASVSTFTDYPTVSYNVAQIAGNDLFNGTSSFGILKTSFSNTNEVQEIHPDGPLRNNPFRITVVPGEVWSTFGGYSSVYGFSGGVARTGISHFKENEWINIPFEDLGGDILYLTKIAVDPQNPSIAYACSYFSGVLEITDDTPGTLYNDTNSTLQALVNLFELAINATFDDSGTLWVLNARVDNGIHSFANGNWTGYDVTGIVSSPPNENGYSNLAIDRNGYKFWGTWSNGVIGFTETGGGIIKNITELNNLPINDVRSVAIDKRNQLWIGTTEGLRVVFNPGNFFNDDDITAEAIIILDDGEPSELLFQQFINVITVDGNNNKWIGTSDAGVFYVSSDGRETIHHFTKDNSPLPTNVVNDVQIDEQSGEVFIATPKGLLSFKGTSIAPSEDLSDVYAFPNPVRPGFSGNLTIAGLVNGANVKVADVEGNLVFETVAEGGSIQWDMTAFGRHKVASGVYVILVSNDDGTETAISKVMIVR